MKLDDRSERNVATLHPKVQSLARSFLIAANKILSRSGVVAKIISGTRTWQEQDALYAKGRTAPGPKVTNARAGFSNHNFGVAFDIGLFQGKTYLGDSPLYKELGPLGESLGLKWGGRFKSLVDYPHYEFNTGLTLSQMRDRVKSGKDIFS